jgi:hypothetical protein
LWRRRGDSVGCRKRVRGPGVLIAVWAIPGQKLELSGPAAARGAGPAGDAAQDIDQQVLVAGGHFPSNLWKLPTTNAVSKSS